MTDPTITTSWMRQWLMQAPDDFDRAQFMDHVESILAARMSQARAEGDALRAASVLHEMACEDNPAHVDWTDCATTGPCRDEGERFAALSTQPTPDVSAADGMVGRE